MKVIRQGFIAAVLLVAVAASPAAAAVVSDVDSPATDTVFANPNLASGAPAEDQALRGTISGAAATNVDVFCVYGPTPYTAGKSVSGSVPLATLPVAAGEFTGDITLQDLGYYICRLIAVPAGMGPGAAGTYTGPVISVGGFENYFDLGKQTDLYQAASQTGGYWDVYSAGHCMVQSSYPVKATNVDYNEGVWGCTRILQNLGPDPHNLTIDGAPALLPYEQDPGAAAMQGIQGAQTSVDGTGSLRVRESDPALVCTGPASSCSEQTAGGMRLDSVVTGSGNGTTLRVQNTWFNTGTTSKELKASYVFGISAPSSDPGVRMPGEASYPSHVVGSTFPPPAGVATALVAPEAGGTCTSVNDPCGSLTWSMPPAGILFGANHEPIFDYERTVPPGCGARLEFVYSQAMNQSSLDDMVSVNEAALDNSASLICETPAPPGPPGPPATTPPGPAGKKKKCKKRKAKRASAAKKKCKKKKKKKGRR